MTLWYNIYYFFSFSGRFHCRVASVCLLLCMCISSGYYKLAITSLPSGWTPAVAQTKIMNIALYLGQACAEFDSTTGSQLPHKPDKGLFELPISLEVNLNRVKMVRVLLHTHTHTLTSTLIYVCALLRTLTVFTDLLCCESASCESCCNSVECLPQDICHNWQTRKVDDGYMTFYWYHLKLSSDCRMKSCLSHEYSHHRGHWRRPFGLWLKTQIRCVPAIMCDLCGTQDYNSFCRQSESYEGLDTSEVRCFLVLTFFKFWKKRGWSSYSLCFIHIGQTGINIFNVWLTGLKQDLYNKMIAWTQIHTNYNSFVSVNGEITA